MFSRTALPPLLLKLEPLELRSKHRALPTSSQGRKLQSRQGQADQRHQRNQQETLSRSGGPSENRHSPELTTQLLAGELKDNVAQALYVITFSKDTY